MTKGVFLFIFLLSTSAFADNPWYEGGTLQRATVTEWKAAAVADQLATSADFVAASNAIADIGSIKDPNVLAQIRKHAEDLQTCVNQSISKPDVPPDRPVAEIVVLCTVMKPK